MKKSYLLTTLILAPMANPEVQVSCVHLPDFAFGAFVIQVPVETTIKNTLALVAKCDEIISRNQVRIEEMRKKLRRCI